MSLKFLILISLLFVGCIKNPVSDNASVNSHRDSSFSVNNRANKTLDLKLKVEHRNNVKLIALVESFSDYNQALNFEWKLGADVKLVQGQLKGKIDFLTKNTPVQVEIEVSGFSNEQARFVRFDIVGSNPNQTAFASGIFNSKDRAFERLVNEIEHYNKSTKD